MIWPLIIILLISACGHQSNDLVVDDSKVLVTVGEYQVKEAYLAAFLKSNGVEQANDDQKKQGLDTVVKQLSLAHQAKKNGLKLTQQQAFVIEQAKQQALAQVAIDKHLADNPITDVDIQLEYKRITDELKGEEFHVRHLLYQDETEALEALDKINAGDSYLTIEAEYLSINPQVKNVGDIGWVNVMQVPEVFRAPLQSMAVDSIHPNTLISQYGVHVLFLENKRPLVAPGLDKVEVGIRQTLRQKKIERYQQLAVIKAKVKVVN